MTGYGDHHKRVREKLAPTIAYMHPGSIDVLPLRTLDAAEGPVIVLTIQEPPVSALRRAGRWLRRITK